MKPGRRIDRDEDAARASRPWPALAALAALAALLLGISAMTAHGADAPAEGAAAASGASAADEGLGPPSEAEKLLFMSPHLAGVHEPLSLAYDYSADEGGKHVADHVALVMTKTSAGRCCSTHVDYRSGPAAIARPDLDDPGTNPVLLYFLVDQIQALAHATHGQQAHFQRRIRQALADEAQIKDITVHWQGKDVPARVIHIAPFMNDPYRSRFEREARTEYDFVLSEAVPGTLVRIASTLPAEKAGDPPQAQRTLTLVDSQPAPPARK